MPRIGCLADIGSYHKIVEISLDLQACWFWPIIVIIAASIQSNLTNNDGRLDLVCS
jgi:hypothetical protein